MTGRRRQQTQGTGAHSNRADRGCARAHPTRDARRAVHNYAGEAGEGSQTFAASQTWRAALLGTVAAGALFFSYGRRAYAQTVPPAAPCNQISGGGTTVTCTGDVSTGVSLVNGGGAYTTLNVNTLTDNITPADGVHGLEFTSDGAITINSNTGTYSISVTGADTDGIHAASVSGDVTIDSTGNISSAAHDAIYAYSSGAGAVSVTSNGTLTVDQSGISANSDTGAVTVDNTGDIVTANGTGIIAKNSGASAVMVTNIGNVTGTAPDAGIYVRSGSGSVTVDSTGDIGANGAAVELGILANTIANSAISVTSVGNIVAENGAIVAETAGGGVTIDSTGALTATVGFGIYARDTTGDILVTNDGAVTAEMNAIDAQETDGAVTVDSTGNIASNTGIAIVAKSQGAGDVLVTSNGNLSGTAMTSGIYARGVSGTVTVDSTGDIGTTGGVPTFGILANSGSSSDISVKSVGDVVGQNVGIAAQSATGDVTINSTGDITSGMYGLFASSGGASAVSVTSNGAIQAYTDAIYAVSSLGTVTIDSTGDVTSDSNRGIYARGLGDVEVTSVGGTNGIEALSDGIYARSLDGAVTVDSTGDVTSYRGIYARSVGDGAVSVTSVGGTNGIEAQLDGIYAASSLGTVTTAPAT